jgi:hypothetical protein
MKDKGVREGEGIKKTQNEPCKKTFTVLWYISELQDNAVRKKPLQEM